MSWKRIAFVALTVGCIAGCTALDPSSDLLQDSGLERVTLQISGLRCLP